METVRKTSEKKMSLTLTLRETINDVRTTKLVNFLVIRFLNFRT